jgi:hypothetical protein
MDGKSVDLQIAGRLQSMLTGSRQSRWRTMGGTFMHKLKLGLLSLLVVFVLTEAQGFAQGMPNVGGMGGGGGAPRRRLRRNQSPALSANLNMVPGYATSFEGQFLGRTLPQEKFNNFSSQTDRQLQGLQNQLTRTETEVKKGVGTTGHSSSFMNYKGYYQMRSGGRGR